MGTRVGTTTRKKKYKKASIGQQKGDHPGRGKMAGDLLGTIKVLCGMKSRIVDLAYALDINYRAAYRIIAVLKAKGLPVKSGAQREEVQYWMDSDQVSLWLKDN